MCRPDVVPWNAFVQETKKLLRRRRLSPLLLALALQLPDLAADKARAKQAKRKQRIEAEAKAARDKLQRHKGNEKDSCMAEARGNEKVRQGHLELNHKGHSPRIAYESRRATAGHGIPNRQENATTLMQVQRACQKDAKAARDTRGKIERGHRDAAEPSARSAKKDS
jgi:hypothetical protein